MKRIILILIVIASTSCSTADKSIDIEKFDQGNPVIMLKKTRCYGRCPVYTLEIRGNGEVGFNGVENVELIGEFRSHMKKEEVYSIVQSFNEISFWDLEDEYTARVTDLPTTFISITLNGNTKKIKDYYGAPDILKQLEDTLINLINKLDWQILMEK